MRRASAPSNTAIPIGAALRRLREDAGQTQIAFAASLGIGTANVSRYESGKQTPSLESLTAMAAALRVPVCAVFLLADAPRRTTPEAIRAALTLAQLGLLLTPARRDSVLALARTLTRQQRSGKAAR